jgi:hypothetical protein
MLVCWYFSRKNVQTDKKLGIWIKNLVFGSISRVSGEFSCGLCHSSITHIWISNRTYQKLFNQYLVHEIKCRSSRYEHHFYVKQFFMDSSSPLYYWTGKDRDKSGQNTTKSFSSHISYMFWPNSHHQAVSSFMWPAGWWPWLVENIDDLWTKIYICVSTGFIPYLLNNFQCRKC